jgi:hypothetical protein
MVQIQLAKRTLKIQRKLLYLTEFTKTIRNGILDVRRTTLNTVIQFRKLAAQLRVGIKT